MAPLLPSTPRQAESTRRTASPSSPSSCEESNRNLSNRSQNRRFPLRLRRRNRQFRRPPSSSVRSERTLSFRVIPCTSWTPPPLLLLRFLPLRCGDRHRSLQDLDAGDAPMGFRHHDDHPRVHRAKAYVRRLPPRPDSLPDVESIFDQSSVLPWPSSSCSASLCSSYRAPRS
jgi:hypothetical protein